MTNLKLIATDLDGTLLQNGAQKCNQELFPLVESLHEKDVLFCACSGRQYESLRNLFEPVKDKLVYLCENGVQVIYRDKILLEETLDYDLSMEICRAVMEHEGCEVMVSTSKTSYLLDRNKEYVRYIIEDVKNKVDLVHTLEEIKENVIKVAAFIPAEKLNEVQKDLHARFHTQCQVLTSGTIWVDFLPNNVNKGTAMKKISEILEIPLEDIAVFGDNENDRSVLEIVGHPYLMENCNPTMKNLKNPFTYCKKVETTLAEMMQSL